MYLYCIPNSGLQTKECACILNFGMPMYVNDADHSAPRSLHKKCWFAKVYFLNVKWTLQDFSYVSHVFEGRGYEIRFEHLFMHLLVLTRLRNEDAARSFPDRSLFFKPLWGHGRPRLRVMDVRSATDSAPKCLFFQGFQGLTEVFAPGRLPGYPHGRPRDIQPQNLPFGLLFRS